MKVKAGLWVVGMLAILAVLPAQADQQGQRLHQFFQERQRERQQQRELHRDQRQQQYQERGRLSPEERRQLREDIRNANENLNRRGPPPPPPSAPQSF
jgi:hypothetical protein